MVAGEDVRVAAGIYFAAELRARVAVQELLATLVPPKVALALQVQPVAMARQDSSPA